MDAIIARKNIDSSWNEGKISISLIEDMDSKTIVFEDNGIGLTERKYISLYPFWVSLLERFNKWKNTRETYWTFWYRTVILFHGIPGNKPSYSLN